MPNLRPSKKHGLNVHNTICGRCGKDLDTVILTGDQKLYQCRPCKLKMIGYPKGAVCPRCFRNDVISLGEPLPEMKMAAGFCEECNKERALIEEEYKKGGVPWKCLDCSAQGVIKYDSGFAIQFRKDNPMGGIQVRKKDCPVCKDREGGVHEGSDMDAGKENAAETKVSDQEGDDNQTSS